MPLNLVVEGTPPVAALGLRVAMIRIGSDRWIHSINNRVVLGEWSGGLQ